MCNTLRAQIEKGNSVAEGQLARGQDGEQTFVLRDAAALPQTPRLDVLFLLDATGSMGDEIAQIQNTLASIAERVDRIEPRPELRFGLVAYRDRGDEYVTRVYDFTPDVALFQQLLASVTRRWRRRYPRGAQRRAARRCPGRELGERRRAAGFSGGRCAAAPRLPAGLRLCSGGARGGEPWHQDLPDRRQQQRSRCRVYLPPAGPADPRPLYLPDLPARPERRHARRDHQSSTSTPRRSASSGSTTWWCR